MLLIVALDQLPTKREVKFVHSFKTGMNNSVVPSSNLKCPLLSLQLKTSLVRFVWPDSGFAGFLFSDSLSDWLISIGALFMHLFLLILFLTSLQPIHISFRQAQTKETSKEKLILVASSYSYQLTTSFCILKSRGQN